MKVKFFCDLSTIYKLPRNLRYQKPWIRCLCNNNTAPALGCKRYEFEVDFPDELFVEESVKLDATNAVETKEGK